MFLLKAECHSVLFYGGNVQSYSRVCDFGLLSVRVLFFCVFFFKSSLQPYLLLWPEVVGRKLVVELVIQVVKLVVGRGRPRTRSRSTVVLMVTQHYERCQQCCCIARIPDKCILKLQAAPLDCVATAMD